MGGWPPSPASDSAGPGWNRQYAFMVGSLVTPSSGSEAHFERHCPGFRLSDRNVRMWSHLSRALCPHGSVSGDRIEEAIGLGLRVQEVPSTAAED